MGIVIEGQGNKKSDLSFLNKEQLEDLQKEIENDEGKQKVYGLCLEISKSMYNSMVAKFVDISCSKYRNEIREYLDWCEDEVGKELGMKPRKS